MFWKSGQTKIEDLAIDLFYGTFQMGLPCLADSTIPLFKSEYQVPLLSAEAAAHMAAFAEHFFPALILIGFGTRFSALALLGMTLTIQLFVYPDAYPTHGTWAAVLLYLMATGPGKLSIDKLIARRYACLCDNFSKECSYPLTQKNWCFKTSPKVTAQVSAVLSGSLSHCP
ncbi:putative oxidoreductase [Pseudomonas frederiksbergensis]